MGKISLKDRLDSLSQIDFEFSEVTIETTRDNEKVAVLHLVEAKDRVIGSQRIDDGTGNLHTVFAENVQEVRVHERDFNDNPDFQWDEEANIGTYSGKSLTWDVAKRTQDAWLVSQSFKSMGSNMRAENQRQSFSKYIPAGNGAGAGAGAGAKRKENISAE